MSLFYSAVISKAKAEAGAEEDANKRYQTVTRKSSSGDLKLQDWIQAIVKGADDRSPRWRHAILLGGLVVGIANQEVLPISTSLETALSKGLVRSVNLALETFRQEDQLPGSCLALVLAQCFTNLPEREQARLNYDVRRMRTIFRLYTFGLMNHWQRLLPILVGAALYSKDGFQSGYFVGVVDADINMEEDGKLKWPVGLDLFQLLRS